MKRYNNYRPFLFPLIIGLFLLASGAVMFLWNYALQPVVVGVSALNYGQAMGLLLLSRLLFGGFRMRPPGANPMHGRKSPFFREKWMNMSDEERQRFKEAWRKRCEK
ncbi:MAG: hypothetical protein H6562_00920 [Lewinellaceae bacterium]|nr:hypothetical protein [Lewinella sp.]MCB9277449.1 hypothetical protein [Lewinellaceae bacterium]